MTTEAVTAEELRETIARQFGRSLHIRTLDTGLLPVHVWIPGYPPSPLALLHGLGVAVGRLAERVRDRSFTAPGYPERADGDSSHRWISRRGVTGYRYRIPATGHLRPALHGHPERRSGIACEVIVRLIPDCWLEHLTEPPRIRSVPPSPGAVLAPRPAGLLGVSWADGAGMRISSQPPHNLDLAVASILEPEVPAGGIERPMAAFHTKGCDCPS